MATALSACWRRTPGLALRECLDRPELGLPTELDRSVLEAEQAGPRSGAGDPGPAP